MGKRKVLCHRCFDPEFQTAPAGQCGCRFWPTFERAQDLVDQRLAVRLADSSIAFLRKNRTDPINWCQTMQRREIEELIGARGPMRQARQKKRARWYQRAESVAVKFGGEALFPVQKVPR